MYFIEPDMSINTRSFIKPTFKLWSIYPYGDHIISSELEIICYIQFKSCITAEIRTEIMSVNKHFAFTIYAIKLQHIFIAWIFLRNSKCFSVPTDTVFGMCHTNRFITMRIHFETGWFFKWQFNHPIMRNIYCSPCYIIKVRIDTGIAGFTCFLINILDAVIKIFFRICCITQMKFPSFIQRDLFSDWLCKNVRWNNNWKNNQ